MDSAGGEVSEKTLLLARLFFGELGRFNVDRFTAFPVAIRVVGASLSAFLLENTLLMLTNTICSLKIAKGHS